MMMSPRSVTLLLMWVVACSTQRVTQQYVKECEGDRKLVKSPSGEVCGLKLNATDGTPYWVFGGLPYAQPPVGSLRFMDPVPYGQWDGIKDGKIMTPLCPLMGPNPESDEDCLFLDVHSPMGRNLPVMVFFDFGALSLGVGFITPMRPYKWMTKRVVFVTIQNRVHTLGLLSTGDKVAPGNQALKDQEMALRWIQDNIEAFGGDKNRVTLFGVSQGAVAAHMQMFNPRARGLFSRVILMSGTALLPFQVQDKDLSRNVTRKIASRLNCISEDTEDYDSQEVIACLQNVSLDSLLTVDQNLTSFDSSLPIIFGPRIDGEVLQDHPAQLLKDGRYTQVDLLSGVMKDDGATYVKVLFGDDAERLLRTLGVDWDLNYPKFAPIKQYYVGDAKKVLTEEDARAIADMVGHMEYHIPHDYVMQLHSRDTLYGKQVFAYEFHHKAHIIGMFSPTPYAKDMVGHYDIFTYVYDERFGNTTEDQITIRINNMITELWTNFATHGNPTPDRSLGFIWNPVNLEKQQHLVIKEKPNMEDDTRCQVRKFWSRLDHPVSRILFPGDVAAGEEFQWQYLN